MINFVFCSFKGGTGKTSTAIHLGACLAKFHGKKVLLVDLDPQANLSVGLGVGCDVEESIASVLSSKRRITETIQSTSIDDLFVIPSNSRLDGIERTHQLLGDHYAHERLRVVLSELNGLFDFCFLDTQPSLGWLTQSAFFASRYSVICSILEAYSVLSLRKLREFQNSIVKYHRVDTFGIVLSFWDRRGATNKDFLDEISYTFPNLVFNAKIRRDISVPRAVLGGKTALQYNENSRATMDYKVLSYEFLKRLTLLQIQDLHVEKSITTYQ